MLPPTVSDGARARERDAGERRLYRNPPPDQACQAAEREVQKMIATMMSRRMRPPRLIPIVRFMIVSLQ